MDGLLYLDHAASTPMRPAAVQAMTPFLTDCFANPSGSHRFARTARRAVDEAREQVAVSLGVLPGEVVFTGCGTESDNQASNGVTEASDYLTNKHDWLQTEEEVTPPFKRALYVS